MGLIYTGVGGGSLTPLLNELQLQVGWISPSGGWTPQDWTPVDTGGLWTYGFQKVTSKYVFIAYCRPSGLGYGQAGSITPQTDVVGLAWPHLTAWTYLAVPGSFYRSGALDRCAWAAAVRQALANYTFAGVNSMASTYEFFHQGSPTPPAGFTALWTNGPYSDGSYLVIATNNPTAATTAGGAVQVELSGLNQDAAGNWTITGLAKPASFQTLPGSGTLIHDTTDLVKTYLANRTAFEGFMDIYTPPLSAITPTPNPAWMDSLVDLFYETCADSITWFNLDSAYWPQGALTSKWIQYSSIGAAPGIVNFDPGLITLTGTSRVPMGLVPRQTS